MARLSFCAVFIPAIWVSHLVVAEEPVSVPSAARQQVEQSVKRTMGYIQAECDAWLKTRQCAACHHVPMVLWALSEAERQGYATDKKFVTDTTEALLGSKDKLMASKIFPNPADPPDPRPQGRGLNMGLPFLAVAARSMPALEEGQKQSLKLIAEEIVNKQQADGSWEFFATLRRPPINETQSTDAAWIIMALAGEAGTRGAGIAARGAVESDRLARCREALRHPSGQSPEAAGGGSHRQAARNDANHDRRVARAATRRRWLEPDRPRIKERRLCHRPDVVCLVARRLYGRTTRDQARDRLPGRHANAGRQLADDFSLDPRWLAREFETIDADHLRRQFLGHAGPVPTYAEGEIKESSEIEAGALAVS